MITRTTADREGHRLRTVPSGSPRRAENIARFDLFDNSLLIRRRLRMALCYMAEPDCGVNLLANSAADCKIFMSLLMA